MFDEKHLRMRSVLPTAVCHLGLSEDKLVQLINNRRTCPGDRIVSLHGRAGDRPIGRKSNNSGTLPY